MVDSDETLLFGVDGGGSGCRVAIGTCAKGVIAEVEGGSANVATDLEGALAHIMSALDKALDAVDLPPDALPNAIAYLGLSDGIGHRVADRLPFKHTVVTSDRSTTLMGALNGQDGLVAAIGTGTFLASSKNGREKFIGGWGNRLADQASGAGWGAKLGSKRCSVTMVWPNTRI